MKKIPFIIVLLPILLIIAGCGQKSSTTLIVPFPDKIIIWNSGQSRDLTSQDKGFNEIVRLTNKRMNEKNLSTAKDLVDDSYIEELRKERLAIEFIYNKEQNMSFKGDGFKPFNYYRLFFSLVNEKRGDQQGSVIYSFQHGDLHNYSEFSRGPIGKSQQLIDIVKNK